MSSIKGGGGAGSFAEGSGGRGAVVSATRDGLGAVGEGLERRALMKFMMQILISEKEGAEEEEKKKGLRFVVSFFSSKSHQIRTKFDRDPLLFPVFGSFRGIFTGSGGRKSTKIEFSRAPNTGGLRSAYFDFFRPQRRRWRSRPTKKIAILRTPHTSRRLFENWTPDLNSSRKIRGGIRSGGPWGPLLANHEKTPTSENYDSNDYFDFCNDYLTEGKNFKFFIFKFFSKSQSVFSQNSGK
jgi:hypothetical protein